jgi:hypothetical protein
MLKSFLGSGALLASLATAVPNASPAGAIPNAAASYSLIDTYDYTNWFSKFTVQNVSLLIFRSAAVPDANYQNSNCRSLIQVSPCISLFSFGLAGTDRYQRHQIHFMHFFFYLEYP